ncbi:thermonuclease family protein [Qipengyuania sp. CAU 1752]
MIATALALALSMQGASVQADFPICGASKRVTCVVDGDTFWMDRVKYRVADIDAPEVSSPRCEREATMAEAATYRLAQLLNDGPFSLARQGTDRYGRTLATVSRSGHSLGARLVSEGLARKWGDRRGWC